MARKRANERKVCFDERTTGGLAFELGRTLGELRAHRHCHLSLELVRVEGRACWDFAEEREVVDDGVILFFSALPHEIVVCEPGTRVQAVAVPLAEALAWADAPQLLDRVLAGELIRELDATIPALVDADSFPRWTHALRDGDATSREITSLEIEARAIRLLRARRPRPDHDPALSRSVTMVGVGGALRFIALNFMRPLTVNEVAAEVGWRRDHLMASFRRTCGISVWQFVTQLRLSEAQRLLGETTASVRRISDQAGFGSPIRLYDAFHRHLATTPAQYRRAIAS